MRMERQLMNVYYVVLKDAMVKMVEGLLGLVARTQDFATFCLCKHKGSMSRPPN